MSAASRTIVRPIALAIGMAIMLAPGCAQKPSVPATAHVRPPVSDWFSQQRAKALAAKRAHQPKSDTVGAQQAYDDVMRTACSRAALAGPGKYPARCDAVLHPTPGPPPIDPCEANADDVDLRTACSD